MSEWINTLRGIKLVEGTLPKIAQAIENLTKVLEELSEVSQLRKDVNHLQMHALVVRRIWVADGTLYNSYQLAKEASPLEEPIPTSVLYDKNDEEMMYKLRPVQVWFTKKDN